MQLQFRGHVVSNDTQAQRWTAQRREAAMVKSVVLLFQLSENRLCNSNTNDASRRWHFLPLRILQSHLSCLRLLPCLCLAATSWLILQAEPTPVADRIRLEYKGSDLQPRGAANAAPAAERQEREVVHHAVCISPAIAPSARQTLELHLNDRWQNSAGPIKHQLCNLHTASLLFVFFYLQII